MWNVFLLNNFVRLGSARDDCKQPLAIEVSGHTFDVLLSARSNMENGHPTDQELSRFARFELSPDHARAVSQHLRTCSECNEQYRKKHEGRSDSPAAPKYEAQGTAR